MRQKYLLVLIVCAALLGYPCPVSAADGNYFSAAPDTASVYPGETVRVQLSVNPDILASGELPAAFRVQAEYNSAQLHFLRTELSDQVQSKAFQYYDDGETVSGIYACDGISAPRLHGVCIAFVFSVPEDAVPGTAGITVSADQVTDWTERLLPQYDGETQLSFLIRPALSQDASLLRLVPSAGRLTPDFSPDVAEYDLRVGSGINTVKFQADAAENGSVRVNRQSLLRAGETTEIVVTVTAANGKSKSQYLVRVNRSEPPDSSSEPAETSPKEKTSSSGVGSRGTASSTTSSKAAAKSNSKSKTSKSAASKSTASKSSSSKNTSAKSTASYESAAQAAAVQETGTRNLYIVGGQTQALPLWILAGCVVFLTAMTAAGAWKRRGGK